MGIENGRGLPPQETQLATTTPLGGSKRRGRLLRLRCSWCHVASQLPRNGPESPNAMRVRRKARRSAVPCATRYAHFRKNVSSLIVTPSHFAPCPARNATYEDNKQNHRAQKQCTRSSLKACWKPTIAWFVGCCQRESVCCRRTHAGFRHARDKTPTSVLLHHDSPL